MRHQAVSESISKGVEAKMGASKPPMATKAGRPVCAGGRARGFCPTPQVRPYFRPSMLKSL